MPPKLPCLGVAVRTLPLGSAYAVWTGIGTVGTALFGIASQRDDHSGRRRIGLITSPDFGHRLGGEEDAAPSLVADSARHDSQAIIDLVKNPTPPMPRLYPEPLTEEDVRTVSE